MCPRCARLGLFITTAAAEGARRHHEAVLLARAGSKTEREAEYQRIKRAAKAATQGYLVTTQGHSRGITDHEILTRRQAIFDRHASEEARNYFLDHSRPTAAYFRGRDTRVTGRYTERKRQAAGPRRTGRSRSGRAGPSTSP